MNSDNSQQNIGVEASSVSGSGSFEVSVIEAMGELVALASGRGNFSSWLGKLGGLVGAKRVRVFELSGDKTIVECRHVWEAEGEAKLDENWKTWPMSDLPWLTGKLWASQRVFVADVEKLDQSATKEKDLFGRQGVKCCWFLPFQKLHSLGGFVMFDGLEMSSEESLGEVKIGWVETMVAGLSQALGGLANLTRDGGDKYKDVFESVDEGILIVSNQGLVESFNLRCLALLGLAKEGLGGSKFDDLTKLWGDEAMNVIKRNMSMMQMGKAVNACEVAINRVDWGWMYLEVKTLVLMKNGKPEGNLLLFRDITARKQVEQQVQENARELRGILESVKEGITLSNDKGEFLLFNPEMEVLTGYTKKEANEAEDFLSLLHPQEENRKNIISALEKMNVGDRSVGETTIRTKSGEEKYVMVSTSVVDKNGSKMFLSAFHDVTERKKAEDEVREARDHLEEKVAEKTKELSAKVEEVQHLAKFPSEDPFPVMRVRADGTLIYANSASGDLLKLWQSKEGELLPKGWQDLVKEVFETNNRRIVEVEYLSQFLSFVLVPVNSAEYVNMYGRDVTSEKEVARMKNEFISMVSHQIRTPLTSMRWYSEMLLKQKDKLDESQLEVTSTIHDTAVQLAELVNDLLSISRMESGRLDYNPTQGSLVKLVEGILASLKAQADGKGVKVVMENEGMQDFMFDQKLLHEVYMNLVSNAIKYTPSGGEVKIKMAMSEKEIKTSVSDSGIGIPKEAQEHIFQKFYRAQNAVDTQEEGTGLGLSVAKMMVEKCGGKIWFESEAGKGTTFFVNLSTDSQRD